MSQKSKHKMKNFVFFNIRVSVCVRTFFIFIAMFGISFFASLGSRVNTVLYTNS